MPNRPIEKFTVVIDANGQKFKSELKVIENESKGFGKNIKRTFASIAKGGIVAGAGLGLLTKKIIETSSSMQQLKTQLTTVTGSIEAADEAFKLITDFASETPFQIEELVSSFVKLKALGLDPSEAALMSYGNTAAAMGKSLDQMIEAVADASVGEFERLKEFGIKAKSEGDKVSFTFQGVTKTIGKNAGEITGFLQDIGNVNFAGAMERQANTLAGAYSNLQDAITQALNVEGTELDALTGGIKDLTDLLKDPETVKGIQTLAKAMVDGFSKTLSIIVKTTNATKNLGEGFAQLIHGSADVKDALQDVDNIFGGLRFVKGFSTETIDKNVNLVKGLIGFETVEELEAHLGKVNSAILRSKGLIQEGAGGQSAREGLELEQSVWQDLRASILDALDAKGKFNDASPVKEKSETSIKKDLGPSEAEIKKLAKLFATTEMSLAKQVELYGVTGEAAKLRYEIERGELSKLSAQQQEVLLGLATQLDNKSMVEENEKVISLQDEKFKRMRESALEAQGLNAQLENERFEAELSLLEEERARILELTTLTEQGKADVKAQFQQAELDAAIIHAKNLTDIEKDEAEKRNAIKQAQLDAAGSFFGLLGNLAKEGSKAQRIAFAAEKAVAIAKALMNLQVAISNASTLPPPLNFVAMAQAAATGASIISNVKSVAVAHGGLNLDDINMRQDEMTIIAQRGERILSRDQNRDVTEMASKINKGQGQGGEASAPNVAVFLDPEAAINFVASEKGGQAVMQHIAFNTDEINTILGRG
ncbi:tape measure protein [Porticoccaceae bacterium]|nr:tape measure protein [Porticoccaceae bacterium]